MLTDSRKHVSILIVDDEYDACNNLKNILSTYIDAHLKIAIAHSTIDAEKQIEIIQPEIVFLDIDMPGEDAFQFLQRISPINFEVIFVTAYHEYAIRAFKLNAVDYILKPIDIDDLEKAVARAKNRIAANEILLKYTTTQQTEWTPFIEQNEQQHIVLRNQQHYDIVPFKDILYIKAMGSYSKVVYQKDGKEQSMTMSYSIAEYEQMLPEDRFFRVHKSYLVNCDQIRSVLKEKQVSIAQPSDIKIPVGRRRYTELLVFLNRIK